MRQEGTNLDFKQYKKDAKDSVRSYSMVEGIASLQITYLKRDAQKQESEDGKPTYKKEKNWGTQEKKDDKKAWVLTSTGEKYVEEELEKIKVTVFKKYADLFKKHGLEGNK